MNARTLFATAALLAAGVGAAAQQPASAAKAPRTHAARAASTQTTVHTVAAAHAPPTSHAAAPVRPAAARHDGAPMREASPGLSTQARVRMEDARRTALAGSPGATVVGSKLEKRDGKLVYAFRVRPSGSNRVQVVMVDATTGRVLAPAHAPAATKTAPAGHAQKKG